jgi:hypothetical protein
MSHLDTAVSARDWRDTRLMSKVCTGKSGHALRRSCKSEHESSIVPLLNKGYETHIL